MEIESHHNAAFVWMKYRKKDRKVMVPSNLDVSMDSVLGVSINGSYLKGSSLVLIVEPSLTRIIAGFWE